MNEFLVGSKRFRAVAVLLTAIWIVMLFTALFSLSYLAEVLGNNTQRHSISSLSWSGYIVTSGFTGSQLEAVGVNASWVVPQVNASTVDGYSSAWVGLGGQSDETLIQVGTEHNAFGGEANYRVWYELLPSYPVAINISIQPKDIIVASITLVDSARDEWNIKIIDVTNGQAFSQIVVYNSTRSTAEWIVERPSVNSQVSKLSDFGSVTFTGCYVNIDNLIMPVGEAGFSKIQMTNQQYSVLASVSTLGSDNASFTVNYVRSG